VALSPEEEALVAAIVNSLDLKGWEVLVNGASKILQDVAQASGHDALLTVGIADDEARNLFDVVDSDASAFADARGAELVGMRYDADDNLVVNPNPEYAITDGTREFLRGLVSEAIDTGMSANQLADAVQASYAFSDTRAEMIGRTEIARAQEQGHLAGWKASDVVETVSIILGSEHDIDDECNDMVDGSPYPIDEVEMPPYHTNCVCAGIANTSGGE
jgi:hypothetical protein